jgi:hypothetical protein
LYLACGLPVLCWSESAIAKYIESECLGIAVPSLNDIPAALESLSLSKYNAMLERIVSIKQRLRAGRQLTDALDGTMCKLERV